MAAGLAQILSPPGIQKPVEASEPNTWILGWDSDEVWIMRRSSTFRGYCSCSRTGSVLFKRGEFTEASGGRRCAASGFSSCVDTSPGQHKHARSFRRVLVAAVVLFDAQFCWFWASFVFPHSEFSRYTKHNMFIFSLYMKTHHSPPFMSKF